MRYTLLLLFGFALLLAAPDPPGFIYWPKGVSPDGGPKAAKFDNHALMTSHRDKTGLAEVHENQTDVIVVQSGEATLVAGGELIEAKTTRPGELQGSGIKGGVKNSLSAGDVVHIPPGMPHQFFLDSGKEITYFVIKVTKP